MDFAVWAVVGGALALAMALSGSLLERLPLSPAMFYLVVGVALGPVGVGMLTPDPIAHAGLLEHAAEVAVLISLFSVGLKLGGPRRSTRWNLTVRLATLTMLVTVALVAVLGRLLLGLELGAAVLLAAVLAPTDPVLASEVQLAQRDDRDRLRFSLSGEGGLNDGTAFPLVMLGLGLLGLHELGTLGWRWVAVDVVWAVAGGLLVGAVLGAAVGKLVVYLRTHHREAVGLDEFLALGLIAVASGAAVLLHAYGFLAVFAAGIALRLVGDAPQAGAPAPAPAAPAHEVATHSAHAGTFLLNAVGGFNGQLERFAELALVVVIGAMLPFARLDVRVAVFVALLLGVVRPIAVVVGLLGVKITGRERGLMSWFGIRGIGTLYYVAYAIGRGLPEALAAELNGIALTVVAVSIVVHGVSVTPLMAIHAARSKAR